MITFLMNLHFLLLKYLGLLILTIFLLQNFCQLIWIPKIKEFLSDVQNFYWDGPYLFKYCPNQIYQRCILDNKVNNVIKFVILRHVRVISCQQRRLQKSYNVDFIGPPCSRTHMRFAKPVKIVKS